MQPLQGRTRPAAAPGILAVEAQVADHAGAGGYAVENIVREAISTRSLAYRAW
jgi:hypothetical protein